MSDLKSLLLRINSVKSTKKITRVMQMIAASKLKSSQTSLNFSRIFSERIKDAINRATAYGNYSQSIPSNGKDVIITISSDKGLCGGYNASIIKLFNTEIKDNYEDKILIFIGNKVYDSLKNKINPYQHFSTHLDFNNIKSIIQTVYKNFQVKSISVFYTYFKSAMSLLPKYEQIFPINNLEIHKKDLVSYQYSFEPDFNKVLNKLFEEYTYAKLFQSLKESVTSENMSRMLAMDGATKNAQNVVDELTLKYNRSRQEKITKELIEIVSSAEVL
jgi:F-type H+-transporting ATPase subunit gamma